MPNGTRIKYWMTQVTMAATVMTKVTAAPHPDGCVNFLGNPHEGAQPQKPGQNKVVDEDRTNYDNKKISHAGLHFILLINSVLLQAVVYNQVSGQCQII